MKKLASALVASALGAASLAGCSSDTSASSASASAILSSRWSLVADGPGVCFDQVAELLDADVMIFSISSSFYVPPDVAGTTDDPIEGMSQGDLVGCSVHYQDPDKKDRLLRQVMDVQSGEFSKPTEKKVQQVGGGDSGLEDHLVRLSDIDTSGLGNVMDDEDKRADKLYSTYGWGTVMLVEPGKSSPEHQFSLDLKGVLTNGSASWGSVKVKLDSTTVVSDNLEH